MQQTPYRRCVETTGPRLWADWLKDRLEEAGWTPAELSRRSGKRSPDSPKNRITPDAISRWLSGQTARPTVDAALLVADVFGEPRSQALAAAGYALDDAAGLSSVGPTVQPDALPVGDGLELDGLQPEDVESIRVQVRALRRARGLE